MTTELLQITIALVIAITAMILLTRYVNLHAFFSLVAASLIFGLLAGKSFMLIVSTLQAGFGSLLQQIGLLIAVGSCLGMVMEKTGAMEVISHAIVRFLGTRRSAAAVTVIGFIVGIPVFCDSGFIILSRLVPSIAAQASLPPAQLSLALASGLVTTHTLVPPTPGPLAAAANVGLAENMGTMILVGLLASVPTAVVSFFLSRFFGRKIAFTRPPSTGTALESNISPWKAFLPLTLPILLIASSSLHSFLPPDSIAVSALRTVGLPVVALLIGLALSFLLIRKSQAREWPSWISEALKDAGIIILITGAGGAFGAVIKASGIDDILKDYVSSSRSSGIIFLGIAFIIAAILKTAQGSTTSSMIITSSLLAPLAGAAGFASPADLAILIVAIGGGGLIVSHANDSYFWVISQFGGISPRDAFKYTTMTLILGLTTFITSVVMFILL